MILFPAIDLKDGVCVRLEQGDMKRATVFNRDPAAQAHRFEAQGFRYLHLVDLDGAFAGRPVNAAPPPPPRAPAPGGANAPGATSVAMVTFVLARFSVVTFSHDAAEACAAGQRQMMARADMKEVVRIRLISP